MFGHMFQRQSLVDLRRRALTLIDVVTERQGNGPLRPQRLLAAFSVSLVYWYYLLPASRGGGVREEYLREGYRDVSVRAGGPWSEVHWHWAACITVTYLLGIMIGVQIMEGRPPVSRHVFEYMFIYNATQVMLNATLGFNLWREAWKLGYPFPWGNALDVSSTGHRLGMLIWFQYHIRQLELLDTVFVILRKKFQRMSFLHVYLRLVHMWGWFFACRYACGGDSYFPAAVNSTCQVIVYLYYAMSMINEKGLPLMRRARVTEVQVLQFVICATHATYVLTFGCLPRAVAALSLAVMFSGLVLYVEWNDHQPQFGPRRSIELSMFGHMFQRQHRLVDLRRRALTLIDVVTERQLNGPLMPHRLLTAFGVSLVYWYFILPACRDWGISRWYREGLATAYVRAGGPWAEVHWSVAALTTVGYLFVVFAGVRVMERRPPVQKRVFEYMFIYNATQVMLNASLSFTLWREAWRIGFPSLWGNALDFSPSSHRLGMLLWFQYHCRQLELLDTIFVILRKKFHHMSFLHIFLRLAHMWGWFFVCRYACGGDSYFPAAVNCMCQVIVYLYYTLSLIDEQGVPLVRRARVTEVQVLQFVICAAHACYVLYAGNIPRAVAGLSLFIMGASLILYADFGGDHPRLGKRCDTEQDHSRLTFRFDSSGWFYVYHFGVAQWLEEHLLPEGLTSDEASTDRYPKSVAFSGSSGGALVAGALATGIKIRDLFEFVLGQHAECRRSPHLMFPAVERAMDKFLPRNAAPSMSGRVRVLLTRISIKPPFITGDVVDQFGTWSDVFHGLRASCHVPGLHMCPYRYHGRLYFDGLVWSSLLVPWSGDDANLVVKVSATSAPLTDLRAPLSPPWWILLPPHVDVLRGLFWVGYRDAAQWFTEPPQDPNPCRCRATPGRARRGGESSPLHAAAAGLAGDIPQDKAAADPLSASRFKKHAMAQSLLLRQPKDRPIEDPVTGQSVEELVRCYRRAVDKSFKATLRVAFAACALGAIAAWVAAVYF